MKDFVEQAVRTEAPITPELIARLTHHARGVHAYTGIGTEAGELMDQFKRHIFYGKPLDFANLREECGDLFWYIAILFDEYGGDFPSVMEGVIAKLRARYPDRFTQNDALNRDTNKEMAEFVQAENTPANTTLLDSGD